MNTNKVTVFTTVDGRKFYGSDSRKEAENHEKELVANVKRAIYDSKVGRVILDGYPIFSGKYKDVDAYWETVKKEERWVDRWNMFIKEFDEHATCPDDLQDFSEFADMIHDLIEVCGGIEEVKEIHRLAQKY
jgi:hypothetical protein